ncbi:deoxyribose-phosphate aldolase [Patescibacteria group bacterium]|nr:deoxyribose-phosphate aldolase [Patescibacteria group bacterium]
MDIAKYLDLANHHPNSTEADIKNICDKVKEYGFNSAFVNPFYIQYAKSFGVKVGTVISFPLGQETLSVKSGCAESYASLGADELDVSLNVGYIKSGKYTESLVEMKAVVEAARRINPKIIIKFIPETGYLTPDEIKQTAEIMADSGADFFKTCSGLGPRGATVEDIKLVREAIGKKLKIKVAGGIETFTQAKSFIDAGADRIGTSHAVEITTKSAATKFSGE